MKKYMNGIMNLIIYIMNMVISYGIAHNMWIDQMPPVEQSIYEKILSIWLIPSMLMAFISALLLFLLNKFAFQKEQRIYYYMIIMFIIAIINITMFRVGINITY
ncbi:MAG: hypothetical protein Q4D02_05465 [Clostridia bacterium]|nr:hypothetical protein [Clostridia bacterium]